MNAHVSTRLLTVVIITLTCAMPAIARVQDAPEVARLAERWAAAWTEKNLEALMALYTDDAVFMPSVGTRFTGRAAIRALFAEALRTNKGSLRVVSKVTEQSNTLAYDSGEYEETTTGPNGPRVGRGNYVIVCRRAPAGGWLIVEHMWTDVPSQTLTMDALEHINTSMRDGTLIVMYRTKTSVVDCAAQREEMPRVWNLLVKGHLGKPAIRDVVLDTEDPTGRSVGMTFTKGAAGQWSAKAPCVIGIPAREPLANAGAQLRTAPSRRSG